MEAIKEVHGEARARYGSPRVHAELAARGRRCCVNTVAKLMSRPGIAAKTARKFRCTTDSDHGRPVADNVLDRRFEPGAPDRASTADITYIPTGEGWLYLAAVEDLHSRKVVGRSMSERIGSRLVVDALEMAVSRRLPGDGLVAHSDRGSQYASEHYRRLVASHGITCSMSRRAICWDNAPMESFFASLKKGWSTAPTSPRGPRRGPSCSSTSKSSTTGSAAIRPWATYPQSSSNEPPKPLTPRSPFVGKST